MNLYSISLKSSREAYSKGLLARLTLVILLSPLALAITPAHAQGQDHRQYLPLVSRPASPCPFNAITNGGFEQDDLGWTLASYPEFKSHDLIGTRDEGFSPIQGVYAARLGAVEGVVDSIRQAVLIPEQGVLSYYWKMYTNEEPTNIYDFMDVDLLNPDGTRLLHLVVHNNKDLNDLWVRDVFDLPAYAGQSAILQFYSYNDNYYWTKFDIDEVRLCGQGD